MGPTGRQDPLLAPHDLSPDEDPGRALRTPGPDGEDTPRRPRLPSARRWSGPGDQLPQPRLRPRLAPGRPGGLSFHRLRHSAGHMLRELGVPLEVVQKRLGHSSIRTTADIYGSLPERVDRPVAEKLDETFRSVQEAQSRGAGLNSGGADVVRDSNSEEAS
ncbi:MAG: tyrosine-type recombinase/integrase [Acidimicrobiales bacterium]